MPFRYRLQKVLDFRIRKKEEQLLVVQKAQQAVLIAEENIRKNNEEIEATKINMRQADPMMYEAYDKYLIHLWEKAEQLELIRQEKQAILDKEKEKLVKCEQAVKVLEKHKEKNREAYLEEEKKAELKQYSELGVTRFFAQSRERQEEEEREILRQLEELEGT
jgi:flagellar export protein FliJ